VGSGYDVSLPAVALAAASAVASAARTPATALVRAEVFVVPATTVFRVEGFRLLRVFSEYLGIDPTTGSCPVAMSAQAPNLWSPVAIRRRVRRVSPPCRPGYPASR
jgi:hypothetical protein